MPPWRVRRSASLAERHAERTVIVPESLLAAAASLPASVGLLAIVATPRPASLAHAGFSLLIDDVQDPGNVGSMLRSAAAAGVAQVLAVEALRLCVVAESAARRAGRAFLRGHSRGRRSAGVGRGVSRDRRGGRRHGRRRGTSLFAASLGTRIALAIGNEGAGYRRSSRRRRRSA